jgi:hypothetical protein
MVWAGFLKEALEVVCGPPRLTLVAACTGWDAPHAGATRLPGVVKIMVGHGRGTLKALLMPLFAALDDLLVTMDGVIEQRSLVAARGRLPLPWA